MYRYDQFDHAIVAARVAQFRDQTSRYLAGKLTDDEFRPLRLQNGLYVQRHGPMLRIAIPYGLLSARQMAMLAAITRDYDRGVGHFTTRQNLQLNWVNIADVPDILAKLASVEMHAIQTSGNVIRNITSDHLAGVAADEVVDPRPWAELLRQWSTLHPEFAYLPRKFKLAITGATADRTALRIHDVGLQVVKNAAGEIGFRVFVGGGLGRTPIVAPEIKAFLPWRHLLTYLEAVLRVYNCYGRRDNAYKARIKILVKALGAEAFSQQVDAEWAHGRDGPLTLTEQEVERVASQFAPPDYQALPASNLALEAHLRDNAEFAHWHRRNVHGHKVAGYAAVTLFLKAPAKAPGDCTVEQMQGAADLADQFSFGELRVTHEQNLLLADVPQRYLFALWQQARALGLATANTGLLGDMITCPGGDLCSLANARSVPVAQAIQWRYRDEAAQRHIGDLALNISGCMNACGHHSIGHIGILGVDKNGEEWYQISIGGRQGNDLRIGEVIGRAVPAQAIADVTERLIDTYLGQRQGKESFIDTLERIGSAPFREAAYAKAHSNANANVNADSPAGAADAADAQDSERIIRYA